MSGLTAAAGTAVPSTSSEADTATTAKRATTRLML
jgi:hypothetical protein